MPKPARRHAGHISQVMPVSSSKRNSTLAAVMETTETTASALSLRLWEASTHRNSEQDGNEHHTDHVRSDRDEPRVHGKIPVVDGALQPHADCKQAQKVQRKRREKTAQVRRDALLACFMALTSGHAFLPYLRPTPRDTIPASENTTAPSTRKSVHAATAWTLVQNKGRRAGETQLHAASSARGPYERLSP